MRLTRRSAARIGFEHVPEAAQRSHLESERTESTAEAVHADFDRGVGWRVAAAAQTVCDRLLAHHSAGAYRQCLEERHLARGQIEARVPQRDSRLARNQNEGADTYFLIAVG